MSLLDSLREWFEELRNRLERTEEEKPEWKDPEEKPATVPIGERFSRMFSWRWRVFSLLAKLYVLVEIVLMVMLYSNIWYMNLFLVLFFVPNTIMLLHYLRLLGRTKAESS